ncbi:uncharacterized protein LOC106179930 [Lingula anatina]|uniref:Uncharacterized protein LOC106179930 n=1 Tax=Lingula anatina TaxID=7574 RepID=A0A1S3K9M2_LINAN|nr:uncharacterized protein LOC106179930 [Lingula anatina]|eukprot:XP_013419197.1 uncharacterized protein LOC106179930 [Lingula anatina]
MRDVCQLAVPRYMMADFVIKWNLFVVFTFTFAWSFSQLDSSPVLYCQPEKHPYLVCHSAPTKCDYKYRSKHNHNRHNHGAPTSLKAFHTEGKLRHFGTWGLQHPGILVEWENGRHENLTDFRISAKIQSATSIYSIGDELVCAILDREINWKRTDLQPRVRFLQNFYSHWYLSS